MIFTMYLFCQICVSINYNNCFCKGPMEKNEKFTIFKLCQQQR